MKSESSKNIQQAQTQKLEPIAVKPPPSTEISQLRLDDILQALRAAERSNAAEVLKQAQANLVSINDNLKEQIVELEKIVDNTDKQKLKSIKEALEPIISNLKEVNDHIQDMINDSATRIKENKEAGNFAELTHLSPTEKTEIQNFIKENIEKEKASQISSSQIPPTTAKKLMPKLKEKV